MPLGTGPSPIDMMMGNLPASMMPEQLMEMLRRLGPVEAQKPGPQGLYGLPENEGFSLCETDDFYEQEDLAGFAESLELYWDRDDKLCVDLTGKFPMLHIPAELEKGHQDRLLPIAPEFAEFLLATPEAERTGRVPNSR